MKKFSKLGTGTLLALALSAGAALSESVKVAFIDPLSGPFAGSGQQALSQYKFAVDELVNKQGGVLGKEIEIVPFDNKISPKESLIQLQVAIDQGIRIIIQGTSSGVANALIEAIDKHNRRNPDDRVIYLNYAAVDPVLTNDKCSFWHFRFDAHADLKMDSLTDVIADNQDIKKVYIIGQDYSFGKAVADGAVSYLEQKRPDIEIVGNELHPIGKVKDFTPYARKIVASDADVIITGNWGTDMLNLGKSVLENGYDGPIYTYYAFGDGITAAFGEAGEGSLKIVGEGQLNPPASDRAGAYVDAFKAKYPGSDLLHPRITSVVEMLARAINDAGSDTDVVAIATALEGMEHDSIWGGKFKIREQDHQAIQDVHIFAHTKKGVTNDYDGSGYGLVSEDKVEMAGLDSPTTCEMKRP